VKRKEKKQKKNFIYLDVTCNPSWSHHNATAGPTTGNGSVAGSSIVALIIFFALILYSA
jgi:hypothetical protein